MGQCVASGIGKKIVINVCDGASLGYVTDIELDMCDGRIAALIVGDCTLLGISKEEVIRIEWCKIKCIGEDAILVEINLNECKCSISDDKDRKKKKRGIF